jgi:hypothetical protein
MLFALKVAITTSVITRPELFLPPFQCTKRLLLLCRDGLGGKKGTLES